MEQKTCYLAVDGGNSKTEYRLLDANGAAIAAHRAGGTNHENMQGGFDEAAAVLLDNCSEMLAAHGYTLGDVADAVLGLAGADSDAQSVALAARLQTRGLRCCFVCNDGYLGVMAGIDSGVGVCYSAGTGVTCAGMDRIGRRAQFGGTGLLSGDAGGGYDITAFVYRAIYRQLFFDQKHTALKDGYFTLFNLQSPQEFLASAASIQNEEAARPLIGLFFTAIGTGDEVASRYAAKGASHAADCIIAVANALSLESPVPVALSGSIMTAVASPTYRRMIDYELMRRRGDAFKTHINGKEPVEGAARWVRIRNHLESPL